MKDHATLEEASGKSISAAGGVVSGAKHLWCCSRWSMIHTAPREQDSAWQRADIVDCLGTERSLKRIGMAFVLNVLAHLVLRQRLRRSQAKIDRYYILRAVANHEVRRRQVAVHYLGLQTCTAARITRPLATSGANKRNNEGLSTEVHTLGHQPCHQPRRSTTAHERKRGPSKSIQNLQVDPS